MDTLRCWSVHTSFMRGEPDQDNSYPLCPRFTINGQRPVHDQQNQKETRRGISYEGLRSCPIIPWDQNHQRLCPLTHLDRSRSVH